MINEGIMPSFSKETRGIKRRILDFATNYQMIYKTEE